MTVSGATLHALATLLDKASRHTVIDALYLRYDVPAIKTTAGGTPNKLQKATHLVRVVNARADDAPNGIDALISYITSNAFEDGVFATESPVTNDLFQNLRADGYALGASGAKQSAPRREFKRPGSSAPKHGPTSPGKRLVFVVHGRDLQVRDAMFEFLRALDLRPMSWDEATTLAGGGTPHTIDIVRAGMNAADAVLVVFTPDDLGHVKPDFWRTGDDPREASPSGQARQNVVFEAGWAMAIDPVNVVLVRVGDVRPLSDIDGLNYVGFTGDISSRRQLANRFKSIKLDVDTDNERWREAGTFS